MENYSNKEEKNQSEKIVILIIIISVLLLLITSCSCTSKLLGQIGSSLSDSINNIFKNEDDYPIDDDTNDMEVISNKELKFDVSNFEMSLSDVDGKISYSYSKIRPSKFTCSTSDASIATCYVKDGYVVINPKAVGKVKVTLQTTANGKIYEATTTVTITDSKKSIALSSNGGTINLKYGNQVVVNYSLIGLSGEVKVTSSDNSVATATARDGKLYITGLKPGNATITLSVTYNGKEYKATYNLSVINKNEDNTTNNPNKPNNNGGNSGGNNTGNNPEEKKYQVTSQQKKYSMSFVDGHGERSIILNTNLFDNQKVEITTNGKKNLVICSTDKKFCLTLAVDGNNDGGNIEIEYTGEFNEPSSLPFKIIANSIGTSTIHVSAQALGKNVADFNIEIKVGEKYIVTIDAVDGMFNEFTKLYEFELSNDEKLDLSEYDKPYKISEKDCVYYKFMGYSTTLNGKVEYNGDEIISELENNLNLYAIYDTKASPISELKLTKTLWVKDIPLFHNEEYYQKYKEDKVIYPGVSGMYTMNLTNESSSKIIMDSITLKEDTVCVKEGCLNMGYMIKYSTPESEWEACYGKMGSGENAEEYWILNTNPGTIKIADNSFKAQLPLNKIELEPEDEMQIVIFWKWVDNDKLDTLIGNYVAKKLEDESINDTYGLSIGINFEVKNESCPTN